MPEKIQKKKGFTYEHKLTESDYKYLADYYIKIGRYRGVSCHCPDNESK